MTGKPSRDQRDLVVLVADKDMEQAIRQLLQRPASLGISALTHEVYTHPVRDNGCRTASHELLRPLASQYRFALVLFDREGSGGDVIERGQLERQVEGRLEANGWSGRCGALVLDPELEIWVWTDSSRAAPILHSSSSKRRSSAGFRHDSGPRSTGKPRDQVSDLDEIGNSKVMCEGQCRMDGSLISGDRNRRACAPWSIRASALSWRPWFATSSSSVARSAFSTRSRMGFAASPTPSIRAGTHS